MRRGEGIEKKGREEKERGGQRGEKEEQKRERGGRKTSNGARVCVCGRERGGGREGEGERGEGGSRPTFQSCTAH